MRSSHPAQLALIDLPPSPKRRDDGARRRAQAATNAQHCQALLAELGRVASEQRDRAEHLAALFEACERAGTATDRGSAVGE